MLRQRHVVTRLIISLAALAVFINAAEGKRNSLNPSQNQKMMRLGPIRLWKRSLAAFQWEANVNRNNGIAFAKETSIVPQESPLHQVVCREEKNLLRLTEKLFTGYASWLCSGKVTFGLLQAAPVERGGVEIRDRFLGLAILRFGRPKGNTVSFTTKLPKNENGHKMARDQAITTQCVWYFPITGGFMSAVTNPRGAGKVVFCLTKTEHKISANNSLQQPVQQVQIKTELVDYQPTIVGLHLPTNPIRTSFYLGTQSIIHALVMWRFHRKCRGTSAKEFEDISVPR
mmetsp:Transcript_23562/g.48908  ORF Transcript_23562/g.48908 Transcript_23562/m.48908 type:complete len:286 (-) Transcript_23562:707-1564(-)